MKEHTVNVDVQKDGRVFIEEEIVLKYESPAQLGRAVQEAIKKATL